MVIFDGYTMFDCKKKGGIFVQGGASVGLAGSDPRILLVFFWDMKSFLLSTYQISISVARTLKTKLQLDMCITWPGIYSMRILSS